MKSGYRNIKTVIVSLIMIVNFQSIIAASEVENLIPFSIDSKSAVTSIPLFALDDDSASDIETDFVPYNPSCISKALNDVRLAPLGMLLCCCNNKKIMNCVESLPCLIKTTDVFTEEYSTSSVDTVKCCLLGLCYRRTTKTYIEELDDTPFSMRTLDCCILGSTYFLHGEQ